uniref:Myb-like domain-containing protein n=1 Tax=Brassica oleracea var. oleracea TaxID=109376 RepID=A0A0D3B0J8_BRAOL
MRQDYSYSQPSSSSNSVDITSLLEAEGQMYADEVESSYLNAEAIEYQPQPEADDGIPTTCYCGAEPVLGYSYTPKDPYRRYFTCHNADDGDCHVWKWWDVAVMEEMREFQRELRQLKGQVNESEHKLLILEKTVSEFSKKKAGVKLMEYLEMVQRRVVYLASFCNKSQHPVDLDSPEPFWFGSQGADEAYVMSGSQVPDTHAAVKSTPQVSERRKWSPIEDKILIGAWLNTSKDPVVSNEQRAGAFWKRIVEYYNASPLLVGTIERELVPCKQRWARINEQVSKFAGCYDAALREQRSGQNDDDVMKAALDLFFNNNAYKFTLDHCWRELRHDQKWCSMFQGTDSGKEKRKVVDVDREEEAVGEPEGIPLGVKAAKAALKKKKSGREQELSKLQGVLELKEKLSRQKLLDRLLAKKEPLSEMETTLKLKLMSELILCLSDRFKVKAEVVTGALKLEKVTGALGVGKVTGALGVLKVTGSSLSVYVELFMRIVYGLSQNVPFFQQRRDATRRLGLSPLQKCTAAIRMLVYGSAADAVDEYLRLGESTALSCLHHFTDGIIQLFGDEYLRRPTAEDLQRLLDIGETRGFPGMVGSIDCTLNDINVLDRSPVFDDIIEGRTPRLEYVINEHEYKFAYYLTDGIYPKWSTFIQSITLPQGPKANLFAKIQEAARKDVERAFGVLQARFAIVKNPALTWDKEKIAKIMRACIILHNMIVKNERNGYARIDISEFEEGNVTRSSQVETETDRPTNLNNIFVNQNQKDLRDRRRHDHLKKRFN